VLAEESEEEKIAMLLLFVLWLFLIWLSVKYLI